MGQLAFIKLFMLVSIPTDINDNRRHVHVFYREWPPSAFCCKDLN